MSAATSKAQKAKPKSSNEVADLATWREHVKKELRVSDANVDRPFTISARAVSVIPENPTEVSFESRCFGSNRSKETFVYASLHDMHVTAEEAAQQEEAKRNKERIRQELVQQMMEKLSYVSTTPKDKYDAPMTTNQDYGWYSDSSTIPPKEPALDQGGFNRSLKSSPMTKFVDAYALGWGQSPFNRALNARGTAGSSASGASSKK